jgi:nitronate monooxygenase
MSEVLARAWEFCDRFGTTLPILQAPMAGACPPELAVAVAEAGGMGAGGMVLDSPERIAEWVERFRAGTSGPLQLNTWVPDQPVSMLDPASGSSVSMLDPASGSSGDNPDRVAAATEFMARFGHPGPAGPAGPAGPVFEQQCEAMLAARPSVISSIMGLFGPDYVRRLHEQGIAWFACATTLDDALAAQDAGADAIVAQGMEAGGHRGSFDPDAAERTEVGLFAQLPRFADHLRVPVVATGGIADGRGVAAALLLGASAVQVGTALLRSPETAINKDWAASLDGLAPESTVTTRAYSGRLGRAVPTRYVTAWREPGAPPPAPYPQQRRLLAQWRRGSPDGLDAVNHWAGQSAALATEQPAGAVITHMWHKATALLDPH